MARAYSQDLRDRVIDASFSGRSQLAGQRPCRFRHAFIIGGRTFGVQSAARPRARLGPHGAALTREMPAPTMGQVRAWLRGPIRPRSG